MNHKSKPTAAQIDALTESLDQLRQEISKVIVGQTSVVDGLLVAMLAGGHCLLRGVPGLGKTLLVRTLADALDVAFRRVQFTPDLMPSDILGTEILEEDHGTGKRFFKFNEGPIFCQVLLADEINRTPPKTQAALLEAMQERSVTVSGQTRQLPQPFFVLATQNPIEQAGTYPLPEAQLDRFLLMLDVAYPEAEDELTILREHTGNQHVAVQLQLDARALLTAQGLVRDVHVDEALLDYVNRLIRATRPGPDAPEKVQRYVDWGAGTRAGLALILTGKARAFLNGRLAVTLADLQAMAKPVFRHRVLLNFKGEAERLDPDQITDAVLDHVPTPASPLD